MIMKNINFLMLGAALMLFASCQKIDNWAAPSARLYGNVLDSYTGENLMMDQNDWQIRIVDKTWEEMNGTVSQYQSLAVMKDGIYNNSKLFPGTYDMLPYDGPFWPVDTVKGVVLKNETQQDFIVTPYLQVIDFTTDLEGTDLYLSCRVKAPVVTGPPQSLRDQAFFKPNHFLWRFQLYKYW